MATCKSCGGYAHVEYCSGRCEGIAEGRRLERYAVVKWLLVLEADCPLIPGYQIPRYMCHTTLDAVVNAIERGDHVAGEKGEGK